MAYWSLVSSMFICRKLTHGIHHWLVLFKNISRPFVYCDWKAWSAMWGLLGSNLLGYMTHSGKKWLTIGTLTLRLQRVRQHQQLDGLTVKDLVFTRITLARSLICRSTKRWWVPTACFFFLHFILIFSSIPLQVIELGRPVSFAEVFIRAHTKSDGTFSDFKAEQVAEAFKKKKEAKLATLETDPSKTEQHPPLSIEEENELFIQVKFLTVTSFFLCFLVVFACLFRLLTIHFIFVGHFHQWQGANIWPWKLEEPA